MLFKITDLPKMSGKFEKGDVVYLNCMEFSNKYETWD